MSDLTLLPSKQRPTHAGCVVAVVVTHNRLAHLQRCVRALLSNPEELLAKVVVVDNASKDGTAEWLSGHEGSRLCWESSEENLGGAGGFARGIAHALEAFDPDWILLLDDDAYGPHIFHTNDLDVWEFVLRFAEFERFEHRVKTTARGQVFGLPINLHTLNQFFGQRLDPAAAQAFLATRRRVDPDSLESFERRALTTLGDELYEAVFKHYTAKQWGMDPRDIPASVFTRLPVRFSYDDRYFSHDIQAMPRAGYPGP